MRLPRLISLLCILLAAPAFAQTTDYHGEKNWKQVCEKIKAQPLDPPQAAGPLTGDNLAHCDETALYFGIGNHPDYPAALQCGWYQRAHPQTTVGNMFYGPGILTMLYANGQGASRDYDLALRFACEQYWASDGEMGGRIGHLESLRDTHAQPSNFDLCDDITSGLSMGTCTSVQTRKQDAARDTKIRAIANALPEAARSTFPKLQAAEGSFEDARTSEEIDLSGTARGMFALEEEKKLRDQFLINLQRFGKADIPPATAQDLAALDRQLNEAYQILQHAPASAWQYGTINPEGIRDTERKWLALSEQWLEFARTAYPKLSPISIHAQLIRLRLHQLRSLAPPNK